MAGDENSAEHVARFCNHLDSLSRILNCSVIYCHHYSKGQQGQKASMDRASGSGVFSRDVDALMAMTELEVTDDIRKAYFNELGCACMSAFMDKRAAGWRDEVSQDAQVVEKAFRDACVSLLGVGDVMNELIALLDVIKTSVGIATAWRLESTLRDFAPMKPIDIWYRYPVHEVDESELLKNAKIADTVKDPHKKGSDTAAEHRRTERKKKTAELELAIGAAAFGEPPTSAQVMAYMGLDPKEDKDKFDRIIKAHGGFRRVRNETTNEWVIKPKERF
jgi:RecA-family ATPase